jgi:hypothetical protein
MAAPILPEFPKECRCGRGNSKHSFAAVRKIESGRLHFTAELIPSPPDEFKNEVGTPPPSGHEFNYDVLLAQVQTG